MIVRPATGQVRAVLQAVRARLAPFEDWVKARLDVVVCECANAAGDSHGHLAGLAIGQLERAIGYETTLADWAQAHNHASALALLDLALAGSDGTWAGAAPLNAAADLVAEALGQLNAGYTGCTCCGSRRWHNEEHARLFDQLSGVPEKLRKAAQRGADTALVDNGGKSAAHGRPQEDRR